MPVKKSVEDVFEKPEIKEQHDECNHKDPQKEDPELKVEIEKYLDEVKKETNKPKRKNNVSEEGRKVMLSNLKKGREARKVNLNKEHEKRNDDLKKELEEVKNLIKSQSSQSVKETNPNDNRRLITVKEQNTEKQIIQTIPIIKPEIIKPHIIKSTFKKTLWV